MDDWELKFDWDFTFGGGLADKIVDGLDNALGIDLDYAFGGDFADDFADVFDFKVGGTEINLGSAIVSGVDLVAGVGEVVVGRGFASSLDTEPTAQWCYATSGSGAVTSKVSLADWERGQARPVALPLADMRRLGLTTEDVTELRALCDFESEVGVGDAT